MIFHTVLNTNQLFPADLYGIQANKNIFNTKNKQKNGKNKLKISFQGLCE